MIAVERGTLKVLDFQATEEKGQGARIGTDPGPYAPGGWRRSSEFVAALFIFSGGYQSYRYDMY